MNDIASLVEAVLISSAVRQLSYGVPALLLAQPKSAHAPRRILDDARSTPTVFSISHDPRSDVVFYSIQLRPHFLLGLPPDVFPSGLDAEETIRIASGNLSLI